MSVNGVSVIAAIMSFLFCFAVPSVCAQSIQLPIHVQDAKNRPVQGLRVGLKGDVDSATTDSRGMASIPLIGDTNESFVTLQIFGAKSGMDFVVVSPWDYRVEVGSLVGDQANVANILVAKRGSRSILKDPRALTAAAARAVKDTPLLPAKTVDSDAATSTKQPQIAIQNDDVRAQLDIVATDYGVSADGLNRAIRHMRSESADQYVVGVTALYVGEYAKATQSFQACSQVREGGRVDRKQLADTQFFLGYSLFREGKYLGSATAFQASSDTDPGDTIALADTAAALWAMENAPKADVSEERTVGYDLGMAIAGTIPGSGSANGLDLAGGLATVGKGTAACAERIVSCVCTAVRLCHRGNSNHVEQGAAQGRHE